VKTPRLFGISLQKILVVLCIGTAVLLPPRGTGAAEADQVYSLSRTIAQAVEVNLQLKISQQESAAAEATKNSAQTNFLPTFSASYGYTRHDEPVLYPNSNVIITPEDEYSLIGSVRQPLFAGFSILNQYYIAALGLDAAKINEKLVRQNIVYDANNVYFTLLKMQKLLVVAEDTVKQIESQVEVARNFYQVGMTPLNELLQAEVELANAKQNLVIAQNNQTAAEASFNTFLRRPIGAPVRIEDVLTYTAVDLSLEAALETARRQRLELEIADRKVSIAEKEVALAKKDYYPTVSLEGNIYNNGTEWNVDGGEGIYDPHNWVIQATAQWNFWEWGRTTYDVREKLHRLSQAVDQKTETQENLSLEVKRAYLKTSETERNIATSEKAIEQAKENLRINQERYKEQVATTTDVLNAQTLLARAMTNYYNALYDFKIAKAALLRAMGE